MLTYMPLTAPGLQFNSYDKAYFSLADSAKNAIENINRNASVEPIQSELHEGFMQHVC